MLITEATYRSLKQDPVIEESKKPAEPVAPAAEYEPATLRESPPRSSFGFINSHNKPEDESPEGRAVAEFLESDHVRLSERRRGFLLRIRGLNKSAIARHILSALSDPVRILVLLLLHISGVEGD